MDKWPVSLKALFRELAVKSLALLKIELTILSIEVVEKRANVVAAVAWAALAAILGLGTFALLLTALVLWLTTLGLSPMASALAVAFVLFIATILMMRRALGLARTFNFSLPHTMGELHKTADLLARSDLNVQS